MKIEGKTVLLTGGSSGIGLALAKALAAKGCAVTSFDVTPLPSVIQGISSVVIDITDGGSVEAALRTIPAPIDILINNAGAMRRGALLQSSEEDFDLLFSVAVKGSWLMLKYAQPKLAPDALIAQMASRHALEPPLDPALYGLSKRMEWELIQIMQRTYPQYHYKFLFPGPVDTPLARQGLAGRTLKEKEKTMDDPAHLAALIVELLESDTKTKLLYDGKTNRHRIE